MDPRTIIDKLYFACFILLLLLSEGDIAVRDSLVDSTRRVQQKTLCVMYVVYS